MYFFLIRFAICILYLIIRVSCTCILLFVLQQYYSFLAFLWRKKVINLSVRKILVICFQLHFLLLCIGAELLKPKLWLLQSLLAFSPFMFPCLYFPIRGCNVGIGLSRAPLDHCHGVLV